MTVTASEPHARRGDPFKLVACRQFNETEAPFACRLSVEALAIADIHAHCVRSEVIGLLGGVFCARTATLLIATAEPCASVDEHDLHCDMEPVSQARATEALERRGLAVVGWYHSHPTFVPQPSVRDLETQAHFQRLFGARPFVALIVSPYARPVSSSSTLRSSFKCLLCQGDRPYELSPTVVRREKLMFAVTSKLRDLCVAINGTRSAVDLHSPIAQLTRCRGGGGGAPHVSHLQKMCASLGEHLRATGLSAVEIDFMVSNCRCILTEKLDTKRDTR